MKNKKVSELSKQELVDRISMMIAQIKNPELKALLAQRLIEANVHGMASLHSLFIAVVKAIRDEEFMVELMNQKGKNRLDFCPITLEFMCEINSEKAYEDAENVILESLKKQSAKLDQQIESQNKRK